MQLTPQWTVVPSSRIWKSLAEARLGYNRQTFHGIFETRADSEDSKALTIGPTSDEETCYETITRFFSHIFHLRGFERGSMRFPEFVYLQANSLGALSVLHHGAPLHAQALGESTGLIRQSGCRGKTWRRATLYLGSPFS